MEPSIVRIREPFPYEAMPQFHDSVPFMYKILCMVICKYPFTQHFQFTTMQTIAPLACAIFCVASIYTFPVLFSNRQHRYLYTHVYTIIMHLTISVNVCFLTLLYEVSAAPLVSTMCAIHVIYFSMDSMCFSTDVTKIHNLLSEQLTTVYMMKAAICVVFIVAWLLVPRVNLDFEAVVYAIFVPEAIGVVVKITLILVNEVFA